MQALLVTEFQAFETRFEAKLDAKLSVMEQRLERRLETKLGNKFDTQFAKFFGMVSRRLDRLEAMKADRSQVEQLQTTMDGIVKRLDTHDTEMAFMMHQLNRHEGWIGELAKNTGTTLSTA